MATKRIREVKVKSFYGCYPLYNVVLGADVGLRYKQARQFNWVMQSLFAGKLHLPTLTVIEPFSGQGEFLKAWLHLGYKAHSWKMIDLYTKTTAPGVADVMALSAAHCVNTEVIQADYLALKSAKPDMRPRTVVFSPFNSINGTLHDKHGNITFESGVAMFTKSAQLADTLIMSCFDMNSQGSKLLDVMDFDTAIYVEPNHPIRALIGVGPLSQVELRVDCNPSYNLVTGMCKLELEGIEVYESHKHVCTIRVADNFGWRSWSPDSIAAMAHLGGYDLYAAYEEIADGNLKSIPSHQHVNGGDNPSLYAFKRVLTR